MGTRLKAGFFARLPVRKGNPSFYGERIHTGLRAATIRSMGWNMNNKRKFIIIALVLLVILLTGVFGYMALLDVGFLDALYMTVITHFHRRVRRSGRDERRGKAVFHFDYFRGPVRGRLRRIDAGLLFL